ncbi:hypothetical protein DDR33_07235 [Pararcticibacter amylolyticus]|uniref:Uncharacterized protein n=2 Tax=Pararcticibacter amylolyticus TaxID=2173175 RepID=A0A2U2PIT3_9SPHI|nr:hypothetical protein DDR33_07235 [Pararcticibacter amylolyticus]
MWKNEELFKLLQGEIAILSCKILGFSIYAEDDALVVDVDMKLLYLNDTCFKIRFLDVKEYAFYHNSNYYFYNVEAFKLLKKGSLFYLSFDPDEEEMSQISPKDNDFILSTEIEGHVLSAVSGIHGQ